MTQVNLLPWREQARQAKLTRFAVAMFISIISTLALVLIIHIHSGTQISAQQRRNDYLQSVITEKKAELTALQDKKAKQINLMSQLHFLSELRKKSYQAVFLMNQLAAAVPANVTLDRVLREGRAVTLSGSAHSDTQVTVLMKNLSNIKGFGEPILTGITTQSGPNGDARYFQLKIDMKDVAS